MKGGFIFVLSIFLFFRGYAQQDSIPDVADTLITDSQTIKLQPYSDAKVLPVHKEPVYTLKNIVDIPIVVTGTAFSLYAFTKIYNKGYSTIEQINNLKVSNINAFDRWSIYPYRSATHAISGVEFYTAIPLPLILFLVTKDTRRDFWKLGFLYWETMSITGLFGAGTPLFIDRYRPFTYTSESPMNKRLEPNAKNSAFSGHVEIVAASTFFIAKVYSDYYPGKKLMMFCFASVATGGMAYFRLTQGMHFPSDIIIGAAIGTLSGILVPHFHKTKSSKAPIIGVMPYSTGEIHGLVLTYKLKNKKV